MPLKGSSIGGFGGAWGGSGSGSSRIPKAKFPEGDFIPWGGPMDVRVKSVWGGVFGPGQIRVPNQISVDRRDKPSVPVGVSAPPRVPHVLQVPSLPSVFEPKFVGPIQFPTKIAGPKTPPITPKLPPVKAPLPTLPPQILNPPVFRSAEPKGPLDVLIDLIKPVTSYRRPDVGLDLGMLINTGINAYRDIRVAGAQPVYDMQGLNPWSNVPLNQYDLVGPPAAQPGATTGTCLPPGYKFDKCGNVVKTRRRRRRRLATSSDIKDLAALSSVTTGPEKKTWIATHPS